MLSEDPMVLQSGGEGVLAIARCSLKTEAGHPFEERFWGIQRGGFLEPYLLGRGVAGLDREPLRAGLAAHTCVLTRRGLSWACFSLMIIGVENCSGQQGEWGSTSRPAARCEVQA